MCNRKVGVYFLIIVDNILRVKIIATSTEGIFLYLNYLLRDPRTDLYVLLSDIDWDWPFMSTKNKKQSYEISFESQNKWYEISLESRMSDELNLWNLVQMYDNEL